MNSMNSSGLLRKPTPAELHRHLVETDL